MVVAEAMPALILLEQNWKFRAILDQSSEIRV